MARAGRLKRPGDLAGAHQALNDSLHQLHGYAKFPTLCWMEEALKANGVLYASRSTIHNAFSSARLPRVDVVDALAVELAGRVRNVAPAMIDKVSVLFDNLWYLADLEDRHRHVPEEMAAEDVPEGAAEESSSAGSPGGLPALPLNAEPVRVQWLSDESLMVTRLRCMGLRERERLDADLLRNEDMVMEVARHAGRMLLHLMDLRAALGK